LIWHGVTAANAWRAPSKGRPETYHGLVFDLAKIPLFQGDFGDRAARASGFAAVQKDHCAGQFKSDNTCNRKHDNYVPCDG
ncbi:MAG: hypothetical protein ACPGVX_02250, partial [Thalassobaculaceae bacterium]